MSTLSDNLEEKARENILTKIKDLQHKIENNEACPESEQDISLLYHVDECLDECLNNWYY